MYYYNINKYIEITYQCIPMCGYIFLKHTLFNLMNDFILVLATYLYGYTERVTFLNNIYIFTFDITGCLLARLYKYLQQYQRTLIFIISGSMALLDLYFMKLRY